MSLHPYAPTPLHRQHAQRVSDDEVRTYMRSHCIDRRAMARALHRTEAVAADGAQRNRVRGEEYQNVMPLVRDGTSDAAATLRLMRTFRQPGEPGTGHDAGKAAQQAVSGKPGWCRSTLYTAAEDPLVTLLRKELERRKRIAAGARRPASARS